MATCTYQEEPPWLDYPTVRHAKRWPSLDLVSEKQVMPKWQPCMNSKPYLTQGASTMAAETACHTGSGDGSRPLCYQQHASGARTQDGRARGSKSSQAGREIIAILFSSPYSHFPASTSVQQEP